MKKKLYAGLIVVFLSGLIIGYVSGLECARRRIHERLKRGPAEMEQLLMTRLTRKLELTAAQIPAIQPIVHATVESADRDFQEHRARMDERLRQLLKDLRGHLEAPQQEILDTMTEADFRPGGRLSRR